MCAHVQDEDLSLSLSELARTRWGAATISAAVTALAAMSVFVYIEVRCLRVHTPAIAVIL